MAVHVTVSSLFRWEYALVLSNRVTCVIVLSSAADLIPHTLGNEWKIERGKRRRRGMILLSFLLLPTTLIAQVQFETSCTRETRATENELKVELDRILDPNVYDIRLRHQGEQRNLVIFTIKLLQAATSLN